MFLRFLCIKTLQLGKVHIAYTHLHSHNIHTYSSIALLLPASSDLHAWIRALSSSFGLRSASVMGFLQPHQQSHSILPTPKLAFVLQVKLEVVGAHD